VRGRVARKVLRRESARAGTYGTLTLARARRRVGPLVVFCNGVRLRCGRGTDYVVSSPTIQWRGLKLSEDLLVVERRPR
jgi:hypothetical protein